MPMQITLVLSSNLPAAIALPMPSVTLSGQGAGGIGAATMATFGIERAIANRIGHGR